MPARKEARVLSRLAAPVVVGNLGMMLMGVVDTILVGRLGTEAIAAATLGNIWVFGTIYPLAGIIQGIDPIVAQAHGAGDARTCGLALQRALLLSLPLSIVTLILWKLGGPILAAAEQEPSLVALASQFVDIQIFSILPFFVLWSLRQWLADREIVRPVMWITWTANVVNALAAWGLIYGHLGLPAMGVPGAGLATAISRVFMLVALIAWILRRKLHAGGWTPWSREALSRAGMREVLRHGLPSGGQFALEVWGFSLTGLLAGKLGAAKLAAHQVALNLASVSFMVPWGVAVAATTRVGNLTGAGDEKEARLAGRVALLLGAGVMLVSAAAFSLLRWELPRVYGVTPEVLALAAGILPIAALFQVFDGTQVVAAGVLRGRGDTQPGFWANLVGYYGLGLPCAYLLAFRFEMGLPGLWYGLMVGLFAVAVLLVLRVVARH
jgi:MATE family multidrug resistance protein